uniref:CUB domain-containing protein n=1 Tax=Strongyloides stercoralis TaxID=6248 RepID=A0A0K0DV48_STRER
MFYNKYNILFKNFFSIFLLLLLSPTIKGQKCECDDKRIVLFRSTDNRLIFTPEYPRYYCGNLDCLWMVESFKNSSKFHFFASNIDLREDKDFLYFYEGYKKRDIRKNKDITFSHSCTGKGQCQYYSSGDKLIIRFKSAPGYPSHYGFQGRISIYQSGFINMISDNVTLIIALILVILIFAIIILTILFITRKLSHTKKPKLEEKLLSGDVKQDNS